MTAAEQIVDARRSKRAARLATAARIAAAHAATAMIVATGQCPDCGSPLRRNLSLTGWWQCSQFGAESHRARPMDPSCNWQGFTE